MNVWQEFINTHKTDIKNHTHDLLNVIIEKKSFSGFLTKLNHLSVLQIDGEQAKSFLQGQLTSDVASLHENQSQLGGCCSIKGRMISNFRIHQIENQYLLSMHNSLTEITASTLKKYAVFFKANISINTDWQIFGVVGEASTTLATHFNIKPPNHLNEIHVFSDGFIVNVGNDPERFELWINNDSNILHQSLASTTIVEDCVWQLLNIQKNIAFLAEKTSEQFLPQMLDFDKVGGVNYQKGCYTGQEIVARAHYRGQVKKHLYYFLANTNQSFFSGDELVEFNSKKNIGTIINSITISPETQACQAVIDDKSVTTNHIQIDSNESPITCLVKSKSNN